MTEPITTPETPAPRDPAEPGTQEVDDQTRMAIRDFQKAKGLEQTGEIYDELLA